MAELKKAEGLGLKCVFWTFLMTALFILFIYTFKSNKNATISIFLLNVIISANAIGYAVVSFYALKLSRELVSLETMSSMRRQKIKLYKSYLAWITVPSISLVLWFLFNDYGKDALLVSAFIFPAWLFTYLFDWKKFERLHNNLSNG